MAFICIKEKGEGDTGNEWHFSNCWIKPDFCDCLPVGHVWGVCGACGVVYICQLSAMLSLSPTDA